MVMENQSIQNSAQNGFCALNSLINKETNNIHVSAKGELQYASKRF